MSAPGSDAIRSQLDRIVSSPSFSGSDRMSRLLRYLVERTLAGEGDQLKEYVLGVEVFDRDQHYDPRVDSIVRVEARRLRSKLEEYYGGAAAAGDVLITIPKGSYVPVFAARSAASVPMAAAAIPLPVQPVMPPSPAPIAADRAGLRPSPVPRQGASLKGSMALAALAVVVLALVAGAAWRERAPSPTVVEAANRISIAVLPFSNYSDRSAEQQLAARLTDGITSELARLGSLSVVSHTSALQFAGKRASLPEMAKTLGAQVLLEASVSVEGPTVIVEARLVKAATDRKFWVERFTGDAGEIRALQQRIAGAVSAAAVRGTPHFPQ